MSCRRPIEEILRLLPGPHLETKRVGHLFISSSSHSSLLYYIPYGDTFMFFQGGFSSIPSYDTLPGSLPVSLNSSDKYSSTFLTDELL